MGTQMNTSKKITQKRLKELFKYDNKSGNLIRKITLCNRAIKGSVASNRTAKGYITIRVDHKAYKAHRLIWLYHKGYLPENQIDHLDGIRWHNCIENLREVSPSCNQQNCKIHSVNKSGFPGVSSVTYDNKYVAQVTLNRKTIHLGRYPNALEAALARLTFEMDCPEWSCNHRGALIMAIKKVFPALVTQKK